MSPVGTGVRPQHETDFAIVQVFGDEAGHRAAEDMDRTIGELPGFAGTRLATRSLREAERRLGAASRSARAATPLAAFRS